MRIVQVIDSLEAGGAERMAVNYANALVEKITFSGLVATRREGILKNQIDPKVPYMFLQRKKSIDFHAIFSLRKFLVSNQIDIIHAHGSSFFIAVLVKLTLPGIKIIWHDHYGTRSKETIQKNKVLSFCSVFFASIFVVNYQLEEWCIKNLNCAKVIFIPNFVISKTNEEQLTRLEGTTGKRIVFLANLKEPKNHILILKAFHDLELNKYGWSLHLIGKDYADSYSKVIKDFIKKYSLENSVFIYGLRSDIKYILSQATIGVLASTQEGFPVTLIEYGLEDLAVISTNVGYCSVIIKDGYNGMLFNPLSNSHVKEQLKKLVYNEELIMKFGKRFKQSIIENYSEQMVINKIVDEYKNICL